MKTLSQITLIVIAVIALIIVGPLLTIWALNTLFNTAIAYTFWNWLATVVIQATIRGLTTNNK